MGGEGLPQRLIICDVIINKEMVTGMITDLVSGADPGEVLGVLKLHKEGGGGRCGNAHECTAI